MWISRTSSWRIFAGSLHPRKLPKFGSVRPSSPWTNSLIYVPACIADARHQLWNYNDSSSCSMTQEDFRWFKSWQNMPSICMTSIKARPVCEDSAWAILCPPPWAGSALCTPFVPARAAPSCVLPSVVYFDWAASLCSYLFCPQSPGSPRMAACRSPHTTSACSALLPTCVGTWLRHNVIPQQSWLHWTKSNGLYPLS